MSFHYYHQSCSDALGRIKYNLPFSTNDEVWLRCEEDLDTCPIANYKVRLPDGSWEHPTRWWSDYMDTIFETLRDMPCSDVIKHEHRALENALKKAQRCRTCKYLASEHMQRFLERLVPCIDMELSKASVQLNPRVDATLIGPTQLISFRPMQVKLSDFLPAPQSTATPNGQ